jgi:hypothetical protein
LDCEFVEGAKIMRAIPLVKEWIVRGAWVLRQESVFYLNAQRHMDIVSRGNFGLGRRTLDD